MVSLIANTWKPFHDIFCFFSIYRLAIICSFYIGEKDIILVNREILARICGGVGVRFPCATRHTVPAKPEIWFLSSIPSFFQPDGITFLSFTAVLGLYGFWPITLGSSLYFLTFTYWGV